jgi:hypothetical protein
MMFDLLIEDLPSFTKLTQYDDIFLNATYTKNVKKERKKERGKSLKD